MALWQARLSSAWRSAHAVRQQRRAVRHRHHRRRRQAAGSTTSAIACGTRNPRRLDRPANAISQWTKDYQTQCSGAT
jgi:hypothetical protein